jgi:hypothetical protein
MPQERIVDIKCCPHMHQDALSMHTRQVPEIGGEGEFGKAVRSSAQAALLRL